MICSSTDLHPACWRDHAPLVQASEKLQLQAAAEQPAGGDAEARAPDAAASAASPPALTDEPCRPDSDVTASSQASLCHAEPAAEQPRTHQEQQDLRQPSSHQHAGAALQEQQEHHQPASQQQTEAAAAAEPEEEVWEDATWAFEPHPPKPASKKSRQKQRKQVTSSWQHSLQTLQSWACTAWLLGQWTINGVRLSSQEMAEIMVPKAVTRSLKGVSLWCGAACIHTDSVIAFGAP